MLLLQEADSTHEWTAEELRGFLDCGRAMGTPDAPSEEALREILSDQDSKEDISPSSILRSVAQEVAGEVASADVASLGAQA